MKRILLSDLQPGSTLGVSIKSGNNVLIAEGAILTTALIDRLKGWYDSPNACIFVNDDSSDEPKDLSNCISPELREKTIEGIKVLNESSLDDFQDAYSHVRNYMKDIESQLAGNVAQGYNPEEFRNIGINRRDKHCLRSSIATMALVNKYNDTVLAPARVTLLSAGLASLIHDFGEMFSSCMDELRNLKPDKQLFKEFKFLNPNFLKNPFSQDLHSFYAYVALKGKVSEGVRRIILLSGLPNEKLNELGKYNPDVIAAKIIQLCHAYDKLLEYVIQNNMSLENAFAFFTQSRESGIFSQHIFNLFMNNVILYPPKTKVLLSNGDYAVVLRNTPNFPTMPVIWRRNSRGTPEVLDLSAETTITIKQVLFSTETDKVQSIMDSQFSDIVEKNTYPM